MSATKDAAAALTALVKKTQPDLKRYEALYKTLHLNPELSHQESETAAAVVQHLQSLSQDFDIRTKIGGHGLIALLKNGPGKTVLLRADMDALPVAEKTGLEYASIKKMISADGKETPVMHGRSTDDDMRHVLCPADRHLLYSVWS